MDIEKARQFGSIQVWGLYYLDHLAAQAAEIDAAMRQAAREVQRSFEDSKLREMMDDFARWRHDTELAHQRDEDDSAWARQQTNRAFVTFKTRQERAWAPVSMRQPRPVANQRSRLPPQTRRHWDRQHSDGGRNGPTILS